MKPAAMLVASFQIHHGVRPAVDLSPDAGKAGEVRGIFEYKGVRRSGVEPDIADVVDLLPVLVRLGAQETFARTVHVPGVGAFLFESILNALVDRLVLEDFGGEIGRASCR